jgi:rRNA methylases
MIIPITDRNDSRIDVYRNIRERDLTGRQHRFIAEGEVVIRVLLHSGYEIESFLISEKQQSFAEEILQELPAGIPVYSASQEVMDGVTGFHIHRGLLAVGKKPEPREASALLASLPDNALVIGLIGLSNHDNIGGIFRNAAAFGADAVILDDTCCDPLYRKALRVSVGGVLKVPFARMPGQDDILACLHDSGFSVVALSPSGKDDLNALHIQGRIALLLGAEGPGLPQSILDMVRTARIPMANAFDSLNVATTSGIALYQLRNGITPVEH